MLDRISRIHYSCYNLASSDRFFFVAYIVMQAMRNRLRLIDPYVTSCEFGSLFEHLIR